MKQQIHREKYNSQKVNYADPRITDYSNDFQIPRHLKQPRYQPIQERPYKWWIRCNQDFRYAIIPLFGCVGFSWIIYSSSVYLYEKEQKQKYRAQIPEYLDQRKEFAIYQKKWKKERENHQDQ